MIFKKQKKQLKANSYRLMTGSGFTLIELLLVIAIIGILAGVLFVNMGAQRQRARAMAALQSVNSSLPYLAECYLKTGTVQAPANGGAICNPSTGMTYPPIGVVGSSTAGCSYTSGGGPGNANILVTCTAGTITCNYTTSVNCIKNGF